MIVNLVEKQSSTSYSFLILASNGECGLPGIFPETLDRNTVLHLLLFGRDESSVSLFVIMNALKPSPKWIKVIQLANNILRSKRITNNCHLPYIKWKVTVIYSLQRIMLNGVVPPNEIFNFPCYNSTYIFVFWFSA